MQKLNLPEPSEIEKQHSEKLAGVIAQRITDSNGWISFEEYMQLALYAPGLGYYSAGQQKFGEQGDFITSPEVSPLFARSLARPVAALIGKIDNCHLIEFGAGSGKLAADLLLSLQDLKQLPASYLIIELSAELQQRQRETLQHMAPDLLQYVQWLDELPSSEINAVVVANEVIDAMPVQRFCACEGGLEELGVSIEGKELKLSWQAASAELQQQFAELQLSTGDSEKPYCSEINRYINPWLAALGQKLGKAAVYLVDYGYPRHEYYSADRSMGTFMGYYRHRAIDAPLWYPGLQDLTAFVDFTALAEAALENGFDVDGFTSQGNFLLNCGLADMVEQQHCNSEIEKIQLIQQMKAISLPGEMGERFKVIGLSKGLDDNVPGFELRDQRYRL